MAEPRFVELTTAGSAFEAELVVGALLGMGIRAWTSGGMLSDEYTMSQTLMRSKGGVRVLVAAADAERARTALEEIRGRQA